MLPLIFSEESVTFDTLKGLKKRGVKVELGFPDEMWDTPDAEVTRLKSRVEFISSLYLRPRCKQGNVKENLKTAQNCNAYLFDGIVTQRRKDNVLWIFLKYSSLGPHSNL